ncbi:hypothetical protein [Archangium violaceum]|uniref:Lipoprotein n=1 Tax=Archangium violaceum Cb vi76 TaxID=1406225 RepID=A0A084SMT6_9BACT|nr:hypothetical protein [Archangium violaceum]KFA89771.1 hypothetical protein Q664_33385 [Archangium violaceum Cb vi76]
MRNGWAAAAIGFVVFSATAATADDDESVLHCERFVAGGLVAEVHSYPAFIAVDTYIFNDSETRTLTVTSIHDWPRNAEPSSVSINVGPGTSIGGTSFFTLESYEQCASLADREERAQTGKPIRLKTFAKVLTSTGEKAKCVARVVCNPPQTP